MRMVREAQALALISHPSVVKVYEIGVVDGQVFIAMELIDGGDLKAWLQQTRSWDEIVRAFVISGRGLAAAHRAGIVHRDFKPHNVMVSQDGRVLVTDFGLARTETPGSADGALAMPLTRTSAVLGTPRYMAPEQHQGRGADSKSDQFAFCVALWEALYDDLPFRAPARDDMQIDLAYALEVVAGRLLPPPQNTAVPPIIGELLTKGLKTRPEERHVSMEVLLDALERTLPVIEPQKQRSWWILPPVALAASIGLVVFALNQDARPEVCTDVLTPLAEGERAAAIRGKLDRSADVSWSRAEQTIAAIERRWTALRDNLCSAEPTQEIAERLACLTREREAVDALVAKFTSEKPRAVLAALIAATETPCALPGPDAEPPKDASAAYVRIAKSAAPNAAAWIALLDNLKRADKSPLGPPPAEAPALVLEALGLIFLAHHRLEEAIPHLEAAANAWARERDSNGEARATNSLAQARFENGDPAGALRAFDRALARSEAATPKEKAVLFLGSAIAQAELGSLMQAAASIDRAKDLIAGEPAPEMMAALQLGTAHAARKSGKLDEAESALSKGVASLSDPGSELLVAELLHQRGLVRWALKNTAQARRDQERAREIWTKKLGAEHEKTRAAQAVLDALDRL